MISRQTIDQIFAAARVEEVIGDFVQLKKSGSNFKGLSPFSDEKTPSFMVSPAKQIWKDFSSGKGGSVVSFVMEHEQFSYPEALRWLANRYNIAIEEDREQTPEEIVEARAKENQFTLTKFANEYFQDQLWNTDEGRNIGLSYFRERGFTDASIEDFQLGYSPRQRDAFTQYALSKGYTLEALKDVGLTVGEPDRLADRFRERVMFPIHSYSGRPLGFGGRIMGDVTQVAKYLNSPKNQIYHKSKLLYGLYFAKNAILKQDQCILVEGYTDVVSMAQAGIENVVASSGTALTEDQIRLIRRVTSNLLLIYDGDSAGIKASFRGIDLILAQEINVKVILLPEGEDPDSFARSKSKEEIAQYLEQESRDFIDFKIEVLKKDAQGDPVKETEMIQSIVASIAVIPNILKRELFVRKASSILQVREELLFRQLGIALQEVEEERRKSATRQRAQTPMRVADKATAESVINEFSEKEEKLVKLLLEHGSHPVMLEVDGVEYESSVIEEVIAQLDEDGISFTTDVYREILEEFKTGLESEEKRSKEFFLSFYENTFGEIVSNLLMEKYKLSDWKRWGVFLPDKLSMVEDDMNQQILNYKRLYLVKELNEVRESLKDADMPEDEARKVLERVVQLDGIIKKISQLLNRAV
ncbi:MAG: DNA primase [Weeksellaceae bacterium]|nr:DNA primase [Weeksellaceae bacterium]